MQHCPLDQYYYGSTYGEIVAKDMWRRQRWYEATVKSFLLQRHFMKIYIFLNKDKFSTIYNAFSHENSLT